MVVLASVIKYYREYTPKIMNYKIFHTLEYWMTRTLTNY